MGGSYSTTFKYDFLSAASDLAKRHRNLHNVTTTLISFLGVFSFFCILHIMSDAAVQEERQRNRERDGDLEFSVGVNDEMPVEKILEAETAVEQKTELHSDGGFAGNSVSDDTF